MGKRYTFQCWNCPKTYTLFREITDQQTLFVACPYCNAEAVVMLDPFRRENKPVSILKAVGGDEPSLGMELQLPDILPTQKP
jgi:hypothetical protein